MTARAVEFESVNIAEDPASLEDLLRRGFRGVPVVAAGDKFVPGADLRTVAELVDVEYTPKPALDPSTLLTRFAVVLKAAARFAAQIPENHLADKLPARDRTYLGLLNHLFEIAVVFLEVAGGTDFKGVRAGALPANDLPVLALRDRTPSLVNELFECSEMNFDRPVDTYYGEQTLHAVLERSTWHAAQHARQVMMVLGTLDIRLDQPLVAADFEGLPMPEKVWDS